MPTLLSPFAFSLALARGARSARFGCVMAPLLVLGAVTCVPDAALAQAPQEPERQWSELLDAERGVTLGLVSAGVLSPQEAEQAGALSLNETVRLIQEGGRSYLSPSQRERVRLELGGVLALQLSETPFEQQVAMSTSTKLAVADFYRSQGDARAVPIYQEMIEAFEKQEKNKPGSFSEVWLKPLSHLGMFYFEQGQYLQSAQTWERWRDMPLNDEWQAIWRLDAARAYSKIGQTVKAQQLYAEIARSSEESLAGGAIIEGFRAELRLDPAKAEARLLQLEKEVAIPSARLATQFLLAWARYQAGDWDAFLQRSQSVLAQYEKIDEQSRRRAYASLALQLEDAQKWAKLWQTNFIVAENPDLDLRFDGPLQQPVERRVFVNTAAPTQLQVTVEGDTNRVSVRLEESPWAPELADIRYQQIVVVTIAPGEPQANATLRIASVDDADEPLQLPIMVSANQTEGATP